MFLEIQEMCSEFINSLPVISQMSYLYMVLHYSLI